MQASQPRSWGLGAAALAVGLLMTGPPATARAHWMGEACNQALELMAMVNKQGLQAPGPDRAAQQRMQAMANQVQGNGGGRGPQGGRGGLGGFAGFAGGLQDMGCRGPGNVAGPRGGGGMPFGIGGNGGGPNIHGNNGHPRGGFCAGMAAAGGGHPGHHPAHHGPGHRHGDANVVQINGDNNIVVVGNRGNVRLNVDGARSSTLAAGITAEVSTPDWSRPASADDDNARGGT